MFDKIIKNAKIYDGTGCPAYYSDVAVRDGKIVQIGKKLTGAYEVIDAAGLSLSPGFIDAHSHADTVLDLEPSSFYKLEQGVTTEITGTCGNSAGPISEDFLEEGINAISISRTEPIDYLKRKDFAAYMDRMDIPFGPNIAMQIGHGTTRAAVSGFVNRPLTESEMAKLKEHIAIGMNAGAIGISYGLIYPPGIYAQDDELTECSKIVSQYGGTFSVHMRWEGDRVVDSVEATIKMAKEANIRGVISHHKISGEKNWGKSIKTLELVDQANAEGIEIFLDQYPYNASSTGLKTMIPPELHVLETDKLIQMLTNAEERKELCQKIENMENMEPGGNTGRASVKNIMVGHCESHPEYTARMIVDIAAEKNMDPIDVVMDILRDDKLETNAIFFTMDEADIIRIMAHPRTMVGSDGLFAPGGKFAHPRAFATFPRFFGRYVRDKKLVSLEEGIRKMTSMPAAVYGMKGKGLIKEGMDADLVLFDDKTFIDNADYKNYNAKCSGLVTVFVNGKQVVEQGVWNGRLEGRLVRR